MVYISDTVAELTYISSYIYIYLYIYQPPCLTLFSWSASGLLSNSNFPNWKFNWHSPLSPIKECFLSLWLILWRKHWRRSGYPYGTRWKTKISLDTALDPSLPRNSTTLILNKVQYIVLLFNFDKHCFVTTEMTRSKDPVISWVLERQDLNMVHLSTSEKSCHNLNSWGQDSNIVHYHIRHKAKFIKKWKCQNNKIDLLNIICVYLL